MSYSDANGANLRFMVNKDNGKYTVDEDFIKMLSGFGMDELLLPFETRSNEMLQKYATGKFDPETMMPYEIVKSVKRNGISARSNFLIGFRDESWESILSTKEFAKNLFKEGIDQAGLQFRFLIQVL